MTDQEIIEYDFLRTSILNVFTAGVSHSRKNYDELLHLSFNTQQTCKLVLKNDELVES